MMVPGDDVSFRVSGTEFDWVPRETCSAPSTWVWVCMGWDVGLLCVYCHYLIVTTINTRLPPCLVNGRLGSCCLRHLLGQFITPFFSLYDACIAVGF